MVLNCFEKTTKLVFSYLFFDENISGNIKPKYLKFLPGILRICIEQMLSQSFNIGVISHFIKCRTLLRKKQTSFPFFVIKSSPEPISNI